MALIVFDKYGFIEVYFPDEDYENDRKIGT